MRALFQERCRYRIQITIGVRRLREEFRYLPIVNTSEGYEVMWSKLRSKVRRGRNKIDKQTSVELVNRVREDGLSENLTKRRCDC